MRSTVRRPAVRLAREVRVGAILDAAREVFCKKGYEHTTVSEIAARIGVVEGTVFKYFPTKRELLVKMLEVWYEEMIGGYARDLAGLKDARQRLRFLIWRHLCTVRDFPQLCRLVFHEVRPAHNYAGTRLHEMNRRYTQFLTDVVQQGAASGDFRGDLPPTLLRDLVYGGVEHAAWNYLCGRGSLDIDTLADQITALVCEGPAAPADADLQRETARLSRIATRMERHLAPRRHRG